MRTLTISLWLILGTQAACAQTTAPAPTPTPPITSGKAAPQGGNVLAALGEDFGPFCEKVPGGQIDWTSGYVIGKGVGYARNDSGQQIDMAKRAARLTAARNAVLAMTNIRTGPGGNLPRLRDGTVKVDAILRNFEEISADFDPQTRTATVKLRLPIYGQQGVISLTGFVPADARPAAEKTTRQQAIRRTIVIDVRGRDFKPSCFPQIQNARGQVVLDLTSRSAPQAITTTMVTYTIDKRGHSKLPADVSTSVITATVDDAHPDRLIIADADVPRLFEPAAAPASEQPAADSDRVIIVAD